MVLLMCAQSVAGLRTQGFRTSVQLHIHAVRDNGGDARNPTAPTIVPKPAETVIVPLRT
jgi:hypothetical protein